MAFSRTIRLIFCYSIVGNLLKVAFPGAPSVFSVKKIGSDQRFPHRSKQWGFIILILNLLKIYSWESKNSNTRYKIQHRSLNLILLGMGLLTNAGPQPWHPGRKITNLYIDDINDNEEDNQIQFNLESLRRRQRSCVFVSNTKTNISF